jgi:hypothetical protein
LSWFLILFGERQKGALPSLELHMKRPSMQIGLGIALGAGIGAALAVAIGSGSAWLGVGIAIGVAIGAAMSKGKKESSPGSMRSLGME